MVTDSLALVHASSQYADVSTNLAANITKLTCALWIKPSSLNTNIAFITQWPSSATAWIFRENSNAGDIIAYIAANGVNDNAANNGITPTGAIVTGSWQHVAFVYDGTQSGNANRLKIYVNLVQQTLTLSGTIPATLPSISGGRIQIGARDDTSDYFDGKIAQVRLENDAWSLAQLTSYQKCNALLGTTIGLWTLDNTLNDLSSNSLNLASHGSPSFAADVPFSNYSCPGGNSGFFCAAH